MNPPQGDASCGAGACRVLAMGGVLGLGISRRDQSLIRNQTEWVIRFGGAGLGNVCQPPSPPCMLALPPCLPSSTEVEVSQEHETITWRGESSSALLGICSRLFIFKAPCKH